MTTPTRPPAAPKPSGAENRKRIRDRMLEWAEANWDAMIGSLEEGMDATKVSSGFCPHCRRHVDVRHPDLKVRNDTMRLIFDMTGAKPRPDSDAGSTGMTVVRRIVVPDAGSGSLGG